MDYGSNSPSPKQLSRLLTDKKFRDIFGKIQKENISEGDKLTLRHVSNMVNVNVIGDRETDKAHAKKDGYIRDLKTLMKKREEISRQIQEMMVGSDYENERKYMRQYPRLEKIESRIEDKKAALDKFIKDNEEEKIVIVLNKNDSEFLKMVQEKIDNLFMED